MKLIIDCNTRDAFYSSFLKVINCITKISKMEQAILSKWLSLFSITKDWEKVFNKVNKDEICSSLGITSESYNNYISVLTKKRILQRTKYGVKVHDNLIVEYNELELIFKFNVNGVKS